MEKPGIEPMTPGLQDIGLSRRCGVGDKPMSCKPGVACKIPGFSQSVGWDFKRWPHLLRWFKIKTTAGEPSGAPGPGLGNLANTPSKLSLKCATTLEIGRLANRGSYPTTASRFWAIKIWLLVYHFGPFPLIRSIFFPDAFGPRGEKLNGKQTKFSRKKSPKLNPLLTETCIVFSYHFHINFIIDLWPRFWWLNIYF